ncbi:MAG: ABC-F family ATP-binding cassette domain-containing protein [Alphaproteobacteria bacterium]|nr:ABC-F family ATP-binding cassette domain-containing protein [Alphaproteobacteria bacterium]
MLDIQNVTYRIAGRTLFEDMSVHIPANHRMGLIGRNGCGKSTLFKLICGEVHCDEGSLSVQGDIKISTVAQEMPATEETPLAFVLQSDKERHTLLHESETTTNPYRLAEVHQRLIEINAYEAPARAAKILSGLGFNEEEQHKPLSSFSGGWRMRVALAAALFCEPDLLLLDEPTNHLDLEATAWLENYLKNYPRSLLVISHDRYLLNSVVNRIYHLNQGTIKLYNGNYDFFEKTQKEQLLLQESYVKKQQASRQHLQGFIDRFRANPARARLVQSRVKMLEKFEPLSVLKQENNIKLSFPPAEDISPPMITMENASAGYGDKVIIKHLDHRIDPEDRIALLGRNGNGKTTFANILAGSLKPLSGDVIHHPKLKVGYFHQHQIDSLEGELTAFDQLSRFMVAAKPEAVRAQLGRFGITKEMANTKVKSLSGGEKARLNLAMISSLKPNILILDEPTNHLDMASRESLIMAINDFNGAVILITHDRYILEHTVDRYWIVADQKVSKFEGSIDDYYNLILGRKPKSTSSRADEIKAKKMAKKGSNKDNNSAKKPAKKPGRVEGFIMD